MLAIYQKELRSYFINPVGYVYVGVFLAVAALLCCYTTLVQSSYDTQDYFTMLVYTFVILIPLLTMKLFAEERKQRTEQLLLTAPVTITQMVFGKYLAALTLFLGTLLVSCINLFPLYSFALAERAGAPYSEIHVGPITSEIVGCVIGIALMGAVFLAIGMFISSLTENQLSSAVVTIAVIFLMLVLNMVNEYIGSYVVRFFVDWVSVMSRYLNFAYGMFDYAALLYYLSLTAIFIFLTIRVYEKRRWG